MSATAALDRLLAGSDCEAVRPDARTVVIRARRAVVSPPPPPAPQPRAELAELVVTAPRSEQLLSAAAAGLSAVGEADLQRLGVDGLGDLSSLAAGVTVTNLGPGRDKVILRGLSDGALAGRAQSTVGLYFGDLRLTYNAPDPDLPLVDIARVEILRGPQGALYGGASLGGVMKITPNAPEPASHSATLELGASSSAHGDVSSEVRGVVNLPLGALAGALRLVAWRDDEGGAIDDVGRRLRDVDRTVRQGGRAALRFSPTDNLELEATVIHQTIDTRDAHYADPALGGLARASRIAQPHDNDFSSLSVRARLRREWGTLNVDVAALDHDVGTVYDASSAPAGLLPPGLKPSSLSDQNDIQTLLLDARAVSQGGGRLNWSLGVNSGFSREARNVVLLADSAAAGLADLRSDRRLEAALSGEISYDLAPSLTLTAGGRAFLIDLQVSARTGRDPGLRPLEDERRDLGFAPRFVLAYRPKPGLVFYVQAAEGYRSGGLNTIPGRGASELSGYAGDELWSYEMGGRWRDPSLGTSLRAAAFYADWRNVQSDLLLPSGFSYTANLGDGRSLGAEFEGVLRRGGLDVRAAAIFQDPELSRRAIGYLAGGLPAAPRVSAGLSTGYSWSLGDDRTVVVQGSWSYVGRSWLTPGDGVSWPMGDYSEVRAALELDMGPTSVRLYVDNLLDSRGDTLAYGNPVETAVRRATPQRPRTAGVRILRTF